MVIHFVKFGTVESKYFIFIFFLVVPPVRLFFWPPSIVFIDRVPYFYFRDDAPRYGDSNYSLMQKHKKHSMNFNPYATNIRLRVVGCALVTVSLLRRRRPKFTPALIFWRRWAVRLISDSKWRVATPASRRGNPCQIPWVFWALTKTNKQTCYDFTRKIQL